MEEIDPLLAVLAYHEQTKHQPGNYARSLGYLDWATQPDPFRRYLGAELVPLPLAPSFGDPSWDAVLRREVSPVPLDRASISRLFFDALALSAWKVAGKSRWSLRVNPSSGNLHPTEGYLVAGPVAGISDLPAVLHYAAREHGLELRRQPSAADWAELTRGLPEGACFIGLTSIHWRESWKYGERAFRYCQHDVGHAIAQLALSAAALGWHARLCESVRDADLAVLLGVHDQHGPEAEHPDALLLLSPTADHDLARGFSPPASVVERLRSAPTLGVANRSSPDHHEWHIIDAVAHATLRSAPPSPGFFEDAQAPLIASVQRPMARPARQLFHERRSAVNMDAHTALPAEVFFGMLRRVAGAQPPLDALPWRPLIDLVLFVHRVSGLEPGLYVHVRDHGRLSRLRAAFKPGFEWSTPPGCPDDVDCCLLVAGDVRHAAKIASCGQDIAADGAFAVGMLADFAAPLATYGPWLYRRLHWEAGAIGQLLYLEAEAVGLSATGIGCFFDDVVHKILGLADENFQNLYNFTVGGRVEDVRIQVEPAYAHLS